MKALSWRFDAPNAQALAHLCGPLDENLRQMEQALEVRISRRGHVFHCVGTQAPQALELLQQLASQTQHPILPETVQLASLKYRRPMPDETTEEVPELRVKRGDLQARTPNQRRYLQAIQHHDISFGVGPAGTGKTYLAVACAVDAMERDSIQRIVLTRPAVEAGERLGFLPGDLAQKVDPYLRPLYDALYDLMGFDKVQKLLERQAIEIAPLAFMRGRTLNKAFVILDEAQNTTPEQMKMFLTRIGFGSRAVVTGDTTQVDLPRGQKSGLADALQVLHDVTGVVTVEFTSADVVRHPLVARIVDAYEAAQR
jgi:phosphate starvation-inducible PhoH-like protein